MSLLDTTEATRWASRKMDRPFTILGLTSWSWNGPPPLSGSPASLQ